MPPQCVGTNQFTFTYSGPSSIRTFNWSFGDSTGSGDREPVHHYTSSGIKNVVLVVTDNNGCSDTTQGQVEVWDGPIARIAIPATVCQWDTLPLENLTTGVPAVRYHWEMGDGIEYNVETPIHIYQNPGREKIFYRAESANGCTDTLSHMLDVYPSPETDFLAETGICLEDTVHFEYRSTIRNDLYGDFITGWRWDFGDSTFLDDHPAPFHQYAARGWYPVTLTVFSDKGCATSMTQEIEIIKPDPPILTEDSVCFELEGLVRAEPAALGPVSWYYTADDRDPFQSGYIYRTPPVVGNQVYFVEAFSPEGCVSERIPIFAYLNPVGQSRIVSSDSILVRPASTVQFELSGTVRPAFFNWSFGDGNFSTEEAPEYEYLLPGRYQVGLEVIDVYGCEYEFEDLIEVKPGVSTTVPGAFSPNGDGHNDRWFIYPSGISTLNVRVFGRTGLKVFESEDPDFSWDGNSEKGRPVPEGVYVYIMKMVDVNGKVQEEKGTITLLR